MDMTRMIDVIDSAGVYLFIIAIVDFRTQGVYFNYAIDWQHGQSDVTLIDCLTHLTCLTF